MTQTPITRFFPVSIVSLLICYAVTCHAQIPISREDEEEIKKVIAGTTEAFNKHDAKAFAAFYASDAELVTVRGERMKARRRLKEVWRPSLQPEQRPRHSRPWTYPLD